jgi:AraC-like DNA-binding protein
MDEPPPAGGVGSARELMVPTGTAHIVFRLVDEPLRIYTSPDDPTGMAFRHGVLGAPHSSPYVRAVDGPTRSVGAMLRPGVAALLLGVPGHELTDRHLSLEDLWGHEARRIEERLGNERSPGAQLDHFERFLASRLPRVRAIHPAVAHGLARLDAGADVGATVRESGYSHRRFISLFREAAGFAPKLFARLMRFQRAIELLHGARDLGLTQVAAAFYINPTMVGILDNANYSNVREFRRMLYGETLGPILEQIGQRLTAFILPHLDIPVDGKTILTFDTESRTAGTWEEQLQVAGTAVGGPVVTPNEFRARIGLPPLDGGNELNKPLNNANNGGDPAEVPAGPAEDTPPPPDQPDDPGNAPEADPPDNDAPASDNDKSGLEAVYKALEVSR